MKIQTEQYDVTVSFIKKNLVKVTCLNKGAELKSTPVVCVRTNKNISVISEENADFECYRTEEISISVNKKTGAVVFCDCSGRILLSETGKKGFIPSDEEDYNGVCEFNIDKSEGIYGLGQYTNQPFNRNRVKSLVLEQDNTEIALPVFVSTGGYGVLWNQCSAGLVECENGAYRFSFEATQQLEYYFAYGPDLNRVVKAFRYITGDAPMPPKWALGLFQSRERYHNSEELLESADKYRKYHIPCDAMVLDWKYWGDFPWGSHEFDSNIFPDPEGMNETLHKNGFHIMISVWPKFRPGSKNYEEMDSNGYLYPCGLLDGKIFDDRYYDSSDENARALYWNQIKEQIFSKGFDAWWLDGCEPEITAHEINRVQMRTFDTAQGKAKKHLNDYSLWHCRGVYEGQRALTQDKRVFIMARSAFPGQQRYGGTAWSGDIDAKWEVLEQQVGEGLNFSAAGLPYWNTDIGGFWGNILGQKDEDGNLIDTEYRELFVRWFQYGAFCPIFRVHGTRAPKELWRFLEYGYEREFEILLYYDKLRYRMLPYIYSTAAAVTFEGASMIRALAMDFPEDSNVYDISGQFMFGPYIMAAPVTRCGAKNMNVYFPQNTDWYDFETNRIIKGGEYVNEELTLERMPLYVRQGAVLVFGEPVEYSAKQAELPLEIRIYSGADGSFTLYDDEGDGYNYENGAYEKITFYYDDANRTLTIGEREGSYPGMPEVRRMNLKLIGKNGEKSRSIRYDGTEHIVVWEE